MSEQREFRPIEVYSNWCYIDRLDGTDLHTGDVLDIRWPDGSESTDTIRVDDGSFTYGDMGHTYDGSNRRAYVERTLHGIPVRLYLRKKGITVRAVRRVDDDATWRDDPGGFRDRRAAQECQ